ncbi:hypothetical protein [Amphritea japonica]|uniref:Uncharacterized protein n=1 Tax=Amphritea japonica ATCC BAA-1530 TaxID=1278309 RepID=A0A7R6PCH0_9GAMM|nr:hypothetical protein [Amphritea japonica]BBB26496.1 conserved hypothetical protein [Amphritea japonica ATCC BAA-1530]
MLTFAVLLLQFQWGYGQWPFKRGGVEQCMVTKIVLTLLVILAAYIYLKRRRVMTQSRVKPVEVSQASDGPFRLIAIFLLLMSLAGTSGYVIYHWIDGRQLLQVTLVSPGTEKPQLYKVYKSELNERSFTTVQGQIIRISSQDRLQIEALPD